MRINDFWDIIGGIFLLIVIYLLISKARDVNNIIKTISGSSLKGIAVLQGRAINKVQV